MNYSNKHTTLYDFMEGSAIFHGNKEEVVEEEHVLIDLDDVFGQVHIPPNAPYVLSGLDTPNPILVIDENIKLIGEYEETIGTCLVFNETDETPVVHEETGPSEANLFQGRCIVENKQHPTKEIKPVTSLHKILRFRLFTETDSQDSSDKQMEDDSNL